MSSTSAPPEEGPPRPAGRSYLENLSASIAATLSLAAFLALPIAGSLALPFAAVPIVRLAHRRGTTSALLSSALVTVFVFLIGWTTESADQAVSVALFAAAMMALPALFAGAVARGTDPSRAYLGLSCVGFALACGLLLVHPGTADQTMRHEIDRGFQEWLRLSSQPAARPTDPETAARLRATLEVAREFCKRFWLGLAGACWILGASVGFYTGAWAARPAPSAEAARFETLRIPAGMVAVFVAAGAGWALAPEPASRIAGNLLWPLVALYFVGGLSIICHFARRWFRARILRVGLYALVIYVPINVGVALLGLFDWYADFRRRGGEIRQS